MDARPRHARAFVKGARRAGAVLLLGFLVASCAGDPSASESPSREGAPTATATVRSTPPPVAPYEPGLAEEFPNAKRLAGRVAERALTYARGTSARRVAAALPASAVGEARLARVLSTAVDPDASSVARVAYPQLSGVTATTVGVMVVVRQTTERSDGRRSIVTRVVDVRLRRSDGPWSLDSIGSVGGRPAARSDGLSQAARRVLDSPAIELSGSARWDIHRGAVDEGLLNALAEAARSRRLSISVFRAGHPPNVWATDRPSAHSAGLAADIYAVDGRPVIAQRAVGSAAYELAAELYSRGAYQLGSPWVFGAGGARSFSDAVHQDHVHIQQSAPR